MSIFDKFSLKGKSVVVTGGAMGLGKAMSRALGEAGAAVAIADINVPAAEATAEEFRAAGIPTEVIRCDVTDPDDVAAMADKAESLFGGIDVLLNNAGIGMHKPTEDITFEEWRRILSVNLDGAFLVAQAIGRKMIKRGRGSIINTASMSGVIANTPQPQAAYNASKGGVIMLTKSLASEWTKYGVRVNAIAPGYMKTELTAKNFAEGGPMVDTWMEFSPMRRPGQPEELQGIALYLASDASSFTTGGVFLIDGGYTVW